MTKTEYLEKICADLGIDVATLPDRLISTYLGAIKERLGMINDGGTLSQHLAAITEPYNAGVADGKQIVTQDAYDAGLSAGIEQGKQAEYDAFWDAYQQNGTRTDYAYYVFGKGWTDAIYKPKYPIKPVNSYQMYGYSGITEVLDVDTSNSTNISGMFSYCDSLKRVGIIDGRASCDISSVFYNCRSLQTIDKLILAAKNTFNPNTVFINCTALENLTVEGTIGQNGFNVQWSTKLTHDSLMSTINALEDYSADTSGTTYTVTLGTENIAKLTEEELAIAYLKGWDVI